MPQSLSTGRYVKFEGIMQELHPNKVYLDDFARKLDKITADSKAKGILPEDYEQELKATTEQIRKGLAVDTVAANGSSAGPTGPSKATNVGHGQSTAKPAAQTSVKLDTLPQSKSVGGLRALIPNFIGYPTVQQHPPSPHLPSPPPSAGDKDAPYKLPHSPGMMHHGNSNPLSDDGINFWPSVRDDMEKTIQKIRDATNDQKIDMLLLALNEPIAALINAWSIKEFPESTVCSE